MYMSYTDVGRTFQAEDLEFGDVLGKGFFGQVVKVSFLIRK